MTAADVAGLLDQLDALHAAATPEGPWVSERMFWKLRSEELEDGWWRHIVDENGTVALLPEVDDDIVGDATAEERAALIVAAVNAVPHLTAALRAVHALADELETDSREAKWLADVARRRDDRELQRINMRHARVAYHAAAAITAALDGQP